MAYQRNPNDLYRSPDDPPRINSGDEELRRANRLDNELQFDPELSEGPASTAKIAMFALAIALVLGAVFYGLNNTSVNNAGTSSTTQTSQSAPPPAPPAAPRANTDPGVTTGAAPARPQTAPSPAPGPAPAAPPK